MGSPAAESSPINFETRQQILNGYVESLAKACRVLKVPLNEVDYSERELKLALDESDIDIKALFARRFRHNGISEGKIAGVLAYRLSRFKIVHLDNAGQNVSHIYMIQDLAAIFLVQSLFLRVPIAPRRIFELAYQMSRRHANQETLGLVFDIVMGIQ
jgi:hypothetical protein